jgi:thiol-disulfide isomerase/thioredoxin
MKRVARWMGGLLALSALALFAAIFLFRAVRRNVESRRPGLVAVSIPATDLSFQTLDGQERHLSDYKGKVVFLDLWGTWCIQCVAEMPTVQKLYDRYRNDPDVVFLIVSRLDTPQRVERYARLGHYSLPLFTTRDEDVPSSMYFHQYPATFLYSRDGRIAAQHAGGADWNDPSVSAFIDGLKARRGSPKG